MFLIYKFLLNFSPEFLLTTFTRLCKFPKPLNIPSVIPFFFNANFQNLEKLRYFYRTKIMAKVRKSFYQWLRKAEAHKNKQFNKRRYASFLYNVLYFACIDVRTCPCCLLYGYVCRLKPCCLLSRVYLVFAPLMIKKTYF